MPEGHDERLFNARQSFNESWSWQDEERQPNRLAERRDAYQESSTGQYTFDEQFLRAHNESFWSGFRYQLLKGLRDRELATKATDGSLPLSILIQMAARKEHRNASGALTRPEPWRQPELSQEMVAAVSTDREDRKTRTDKRPARGYKREGPPNKAKPCRYCGGRQHEDKKLCPAYGKECHERGGANHFARICEKKARNKDKDRGGSPGAKVYERE